MLGAPGPGPPSPVPAVLPGDAAAAAAEQCSSRAPCLSSPPPPPPFTLSARPACPGGASPSATTEGTALGGESSALWAMGKASFADVLLGGWSSRSSGTWGRWPKGGWSSGSSSELEKSSAGAGAGAGGAARSVLLAAAARLRAATSLLSRSDLAYFPASVFSRIFFAVRLLASELPSAACLSASFWAAHAELSLRLPGGHVAFLLRYALLRAR
mmetsp:Transcript_50636/g.96688  ORF Transcript_50636/g.96688 Transcript_50636/m.96688 type:complete len:214 (+) Transcript_50636:520-1161(+)